MIPDAVAVTSVSPTPTLVASPEASTVATTVALDAHLNTLPAVAVIVAVPLPAAVTRPEELTVATSALSFAQVTVALAIACPF